MLTFLARRLALAVVTLVLLSVIVFALGQVLPGDVGRNVLGGFASQESVDAWNKERGLDRPAVTQYLDWASHAVRGDFGNSYTSGRVGQLDPRARAAQVGRARAVRVRADDPARVHRRADIARSRPTSRPIA